MNVPSINAQFDLVRAAKEGTVVLVETPMPAASMVALADEARRSKVLLGFSPRLIGANPFSGTVRCGSGRQMTLAHIDFRGHAAGARQGLVGGSPQAQATAIKSDDVECLYLLGHSNGHDAGVGTVVLCRYDDNSIGEPGQNVFPCYHGVPCRFSDDEIKRVSPTKVNAPLIVNLTCWGGDVGATAFDQRWSVGSGLVGRFGFSAMLCLLRATHLTKEDALLVYYTINEGVSFGEVANKLNAFRHDRGDLSDLVCVGDPAARLMIEPPKAISLPSEKHLPVTVTIPARGYAEDYRISIPMSKQQQLLKYDGPPNVTGVVLPGTIYITLRSGPETKIRLQFADPVGVIELHRHIAVLKAELEAIRPRSLILPEDHPASPLVQSMESYLASLEHLYFANEGHGRIISGSEFDALVTVLENASLLNANEQAKWHTNLSRTGSLAASRFWDQRVKWSAEHIFDQPCPSCGGQLTKRQGFSTSGQIIRCTFVCFGCGPIQSGPIEEVLKIDFPYEACAGDSFQVTLRSHTQCNLNAAASLSLSICPFKLGEGEVAATKIEHSPMSSSELGVTLELPQSIECGIRYVSGQYTIGALATQFRRTLEIRSS